MGNKQYTLNTKLAIAAEAHHESLVRRYIKEGGDVNFIPDEPGLSPSLIGCLRFGPINMDLFSLILKEGANPNIFDPTGLSPLIIAVRRGKEGLEVLSRLLDAGADPNARYDKQSDTPLTAAVRCSYRDIDVISFLLEHGAQVNTPGFNQMTPLICAPIHITTVDASSITECLITHGAKVNQKEPQDGNTALHYAAFYKNLPIVETLIKHGAKLDIKNKNGEQPVHLAVFQAAPDIVNILAQDHTTATQKKYEQASALFQAVHAGEVSRVESLLDESPKIQMKYLQQALYLAVAQQQKSIVKALLKQGVNPSKKTESGYPLISAASHPSADILKLLLSEGANTEVRIKVNNEETVTPLLIAAGYFEQEGNGEYQDRSPLLKALIDAGAKTDFANERDFTALHIALQVCDDAAVRYLLKHTSKKTLKAHIDTLIEDANSRPKLKKAIEKLV